MIINQGELLWGMDMIFIKNFMDIAKKESYPKGHILFREGDPANYFFTLIEGGIKLTVGKLDKKVYIVNNPGEMFGWSSLVGREKYSATGEFIEQSIVLKTDKDDLTKLLAKFPENGLQFYKKLSEMLGNRLVQSYNLFHSGG